jgi:hypothetical protein
MSSLVKTRNCILTLKLMDSLLLTSKALNTW